MPLDHAAAGHRVALLWLYWPEEECDYFEGNGIDNFGGKACSGAYVATLGTVERESGGYRLVEATAPPSYVHGMDTDVAEALVVEIPPDVDPASMTLDDAAGIAPRHAVIYVPAPLDVDRIEAQELGGVALGSGFHLARIVDDGPQVEGTSLEGNLVITRQAGRIVENEAVAIEPTRLDDDGYVVPLPPHLGL